MFPFNFPTKRNESGPGASMRASFCRGLLAAGCLGGGIPVASAATEASHPNIVIIYADDLGYGDVSCYGATRIATPNIDRLAKDGLRFTDGHAPASTCTPSRFSLLTGRYAFRTPGVSILTGDAGALIKPGMTTLPSLLQTAGYHTGIIGKWHLGLGDGTINWNGEIKPGPMEVGFNEQFIMPATLDRVPCVFLDGHRVLNLDPADPIRISYARKVGNEPTGFSDPEMLKMKADPQHSGTIVNGVSRIGYMTGGKSALWKDEDIADQLTARVADFIDRNKKQPFFLYFATPEPHVPRMPNPRFVGKTEMGPRGDVIVQLDWVVGQVLDAIDKAGLRDNTLVIFSSDNGPVLNDGYQDDAVRLVGTHRPAGPFRGGKYMSEEGGTRVPMIVRWPGHVRVGESNALISHVDFLASFAAFTGQTLSKEAQGDSLNELPALLGSAAAGRPFLLEEGVHNMGFRLGEWKIIEETQRHNGTNPPAKYAEAVQLYNVTADVGEKKNLAAREPERVKQLQERFSEVLAPEINTSR